jgi:hypothetical protein
MADHFVHAGDVSHAVIGKIGTEARTRTSFYLLQYGKSIDIYGRKSTILGTVYILRGRLCDVVGFYDAETFNI